MTWLGFYSKNKRFLFFVALFFFSVGYAYFGCVAYLMAPSKDILNQILVPRTVFMIVWEAFCIFLLTLILAERGETFRELGLSWRMKDLFHSIALYVGSYLFCTALLVGYHYCLYFSGLDFNSMTDFSSGKDIMEAMPKMPVLVLLLLTVINPVFEEVIVRAFFITEMNSLFKKVWLSVFLSALVQAGYHLYQGWSYTTMHFLTFLIFSIYYQKTKRLLPLVLAHFYMDALPLLGNHFIPHFLHHGEVMK